MKSPILDAYYLTKNLTAFYLTFTSIEWLSMTDIFLKNKFNLSELSLEDLKELPLIFQKIYRFLFQKNIFYGLLILRFFFAMALFYYFNPLIILYLLGTTLLIIHRFKGSFNGGSDSMTLLTLTTLLVGSLSLHHPYFLKVAAGYLSIQVILSYFYAGLVKAKGVDWKSGHALYLLSVGHNYAPPLFLKKLFQHQLIGKLGTYFILYAELLSPLILLIKNPKIIAVTLLTLGSFHFINFLYFGLNRFFWSWISTYPLLYYFLMTNHL